MASSTSSEMITDKQNLEAICDYLRGIDNNTDADFLLDRFEAMSGLIRELIVENPESFPANKAEIYMEIFYSQPQHPVANYVEK